MLQLLMPLPNKDKNFSTITSFSFSSDYLSVAQKKVCLMSNGSEHNHLIVDIYIYIYIYTMTCCIQSSVKNGAKMLGQAPMLLINKWTNNVGIGNI